VAPIQTRDDLGRAFHRRGIVHGEPVLGEAGNALGLVERGLTDPHPELAQPYHEALAAIDQHDLVPAIGVQPVGELDGGS
jgi:hypothetical protein